MKSMAHPLSDTNIFDNLITLENDIMSQKITNITLEKIVTIYSSLIEYYEGRKDPVHHYFKEKIEILLASKMAQEVLDH